MRAQKPEIATWTAEQLQTFVTWNRDELEDELFPLWRLIAYTGMRRSEALALRWSDINTKTMRISIRRAVDTDDWTKTKTTKTGQARVIDVDGETLKVLASYKVVQERLGHSTITTTMSIYSHVTPTMQRSAVDRFAAHLGYA